MKNNIPYSTSPLPSGPYLIFAPHADDETLGMGGTIALASKSGIEVNTCIVTMPEDSKVTEVRKREAIEALAKLGAEKPIFWEEPDGALALTEPIISKASELIERIKPDTVFFPSPFEFHFDHRTTALIIWETLKRTGFTGEAWSFEITRQSEANRLIDITEIEGKKREAILSYESQLMENDYLDVALAINKARSYTVPKPTEYVEAFYSFSTPINDELKDWFPKLGSGYLEI